MARGCGCNAAEWHAWVKACGGGFLCRDSSKNGHVMDASWLHKANISHRGKRIAGVQVAWWEPLRGGLQTSDITWRR